MKPALLSSLSIIQIIRPSDETSLLVVKLSPCTPSSFHMQEIEAARARLPEPPVPKKE